MVEELHTRGGEGRRRTGVGVRRASRDACGWLLLVLCSTACACSAYDGDKIAPDEAAPAGTRAPAPAGTNSGGTGGSGAGRGGSGGGSGAGSGAAGEAGRSPMLDAAVDAGADTGPEDAAPPDGATDATTADAACGADPTLTEDCCPDDPDKTEPGMCGCGTAETDGDTDDTPDCLDECDDDPLKIAEGMCGCGTADTDGDTDGSPDCDDECDTDPDKTAPGTCGCGVPDTDQGAVASCTGLINALRHRYRFEGTGATVRDAVGTRHGTAESVTLDGSGALSLAGGSSGDFVNLPNGMISALTDATFEAFVTWDGGAGWQRIFDFGDNSSFFEGNQGTGTAYLFLTPQAASTGTTLRAAFSENGSSNEIRVDGSAALPTGTMHQVVVVIDDTNDQMLLYLDGALQNSTAFTRHLSAINDINNWFGRAQFSNDPDFDGTLHEFRIYGAALNAAQIALSSGDGPDPAYLPQ